MSLEREVRDAVLGRMDTAITAIVDARERELARRRAEACLEEIVGEEMLRRLPKIRWIARLIWKRRHRIAASQCEAQRRINPHETRRMCDAMKGETTT